MTDLPPTSGHSLDRFARERRFDLRLRFREGASVPSTLPGELRALLHDVLPDLLDVQLTERYSATPEQIELVREFLPDDQEVDQDALASPVEGGAVWVGTWGYLFPLHNPASLPVTLARIEGLARGEAMGLPDFSDADAARVLARIPPDATLTNVELRDLIETVLGEPGA